jgi:hypothetical protein
MIVPLMVMMIAPIALVMAAAHVLNKLSSGSEIIVMNAAGVSPWRLLRCRRLRRHGSGGDRQPHWVCRAIVSRGRLVTTWRRSSCPPSERSACGCNSSRCAARLRA